VFYLLVQTAASRPVTKAITAKIAPENFI